MQTSANHQMELYSPRVCYILSKPFMAGAGLWLDIAALQRQEGADARVLLQALKPGNMGPAPSSHATSHAHLSHDHASTPSGTTSIEYQHDSPIGYVTHACGD